MRAVGMLAVFLALFGVAWLWIVNGRPRNIETFVGYLIVTGLASALAALGAYAWSRP